MPTDPSAEQQAITRVSLAWKAAYNDRDLDAVTDLYAAEALLSAPGLPLVVGREDIAGFFAERFGSGAPALTVEDEPYGEVVTSGDLGWQWQTYRVRDRAGAEVGSGQLLTLFRRVDGRWRIAGDTWNAVGPVRDGRPGTV
ncbi:DUF4440 domain-containing protein [Nocardioides sp. YIM 152315]|uniref:YybH family protein n=1 Tax=Nocardioides sp. YIM 152315 TaxID=3031760 RepID=UPI0023D9833B|nr:DUF4440 domain-containing protein [Nocardioides sp. YIM 152315]MDF1604918.1 DUF4440 domain-containing protein [Nocardioides sp. YIM 152315]